MPSGNAWWTTSLATFGPGVSEPVLQRAFDYWRNVDADIGDRVEKGCPAVSHTISGARIGRKTTFPGGEPRHSRALRGRDVIR